MLQYVHVFNVSCDFPMSQLTAEDWADLLAAMSVQNLPPADVSSLLAGFRNGGFRNRWKYFPLHSDYSGLF